METEKTEENPAPVIEEVNTEETAKTEARNSGIEKIAQVAHEINKAYCESIGDNSQPDWEQAPHWQKSSAINGVKFHIENPDATPEKSHESWLEQKKNEGWQYGPVKNAETKHHPCFCSYEDLPAEQKSKDYLFRGVVHSLKSKAIFILT